MYNYDDLEFVAAAIRNCCTVHGSAFIHHYAMVRCGVLLE
jgi:hypothetical protein